MAIRIETKLHSASNVFTGRNPRDTVAFMQTIKAKLNQLSAAKYVDASYEDKDQLSIVVLNKWKDD